MQAESLYEAAVLAAEAFKEHCAAGLGSKLTIEVKSPGVAHEVMMSKVREWLNGACKSPSEKVTKDWLKGSLAS